MEQTINSHVQIRKNAQQNPKEKSRIDANLKLMKSKKFIIPNEVKKFIIPNEVKKFILEEVQILKATLEHY